MPVVKDRHGIRVKPVHTGHAGPDLGDWVFIVVRHDDKMFGPFSTRHDAAAFTALAHACNDFDIRPVRVGSVRLEDVVAPRKVIQ